MDGLVLGTDPEFVLWMPGRNLIRKPHDIIADPRNGHDRLGAVGVDGDRPTSSVELRPGVSPSAEELVNRMADLLQMLRAHYRPKGVTYRAGAYVDPEPLGGHEHLGWKDQLPYGSSAYNDMMWRVMEILSGWQAKADYLLPRLWSEAEVQLRERWAIDNRRDFARRFAVRPEGGMDRVMAEQHMEFRYLPSWLNCPEAAYAALGGAELIVRAVAGTSVGRHTAWDKFVEQMYTDNALRPPGSPSLAKALRTAQKYVTVEDFIDNWL